MNKKIISSIFIFSALILSLSIVSEGLCKGSDEYYHDCNDFSDSYYNHNFYPSYNTEYYKETSASSSSIISIKESRNNYEEIRADSYAESNLEYTKIERDYSSPKVRYDKYGRYYYDNNYDDNNYNYYEWDDYPHKIVFLNKIEPRNYQKIDNSNRERDNYESQSSSSEYYWENAGEYNAEDYSSQYDYYYYKPRYNNYNQEFNWKW